MAKRRVVKEQAQEMPVPDPRAAEAVALVQELDRSIEQCPLCGKWNSRTVGHNRGCWLGTYTGRFVA